MKYKALLEGLEISEISLKDALKGNLVFRCDAEYFQKRYIYEDKQREKFTPNELGTLAFITDGQHGYHEVDEDSLISHLTAKNFKNWFADKNNADPLAEWVDLKNKRSSLQVNDVVLTTRGTVGCCAIVKADVLPANIDQDVARIALHKNDRIKSPFLITYLNSKFGQDWIRRNSTGMVQQGLSLLRLKQMPIPLLAIEFQNKISAIIELAYSRIEESKALYTTAENQLLETLGLKDYKTKKEAVNIKSFSSSFANSGRLDAEYYQKKYEDLETKIINYVGGYDRLGNQLESIDTGEYSSEYDVEQEGFVFYIRNTNIKKGIIEKDLEHYVKSSSFKKRTRKGSILTARVGAIGSFGLITKELENCVYSDNVFNLTLKSLLNPEAYTLYFNSLPNQVQLEKISGGSVQPLITQTSIKELLIPILKTETQTYLAELVRRSRELKKESEFLLNAAKTAVERAIEESEEAAMAWLQKNTPSVF